MESTYRTESAAQKLGEHCGYCFGDVLRYETFLKGSSYPDPKTARLAYAAYLEGFAKGIRRIYH